ncbi:MAG: hypothetical protein LE180_05435 [Endomicrobium sp.]|uniref:hypothetical protein n=1 Tax=Candidatus Endomicrobiellum pyrsonymphae TaxID=1408203 RepID=UPI003582FCDD|nr:hypothetical protein [Endomicrobium sp.]
MTSRNIVAKCGHIARRLKQDESLKGKVLEFALDVIGENRTCGNDNQLLNTIVEKLKVGRQLNEYECHTM